jgi:hypothetical protein
MKVKIQFIIIQLLWSQSRNQNGTSNVQIWDSGNRLVEEYIRSCDQFKRYEKKKTSPGLMKMKFYSCAYRNCQDSAHTGYTRLSHKSLGFCSMTCAVRLKCRVDKYQPKTTLIYWIRASCKSGNLFDNGLNPGGWRPLNLLSLFTCDINISFLRSYSVAYLNARKGIEPSFE